MIRRLCKKTVFNKQPMISPQLIVFCLILSYQQYVCSDVLYRNGACDNGECSVSNHVNIQSKQERGLKSPESNRSPTTMNIASNDRSKDHSFQLNTMKRNRSVKKYDVRNHPKIAVKCSKNSGHFAHLNCIDSRLSPTLVSTNGRKYKPSYIPQSRLDYFNDDFPVFCTYGLKFFLVGIKNRLNGLFACIIISAMIFMSVAIIFMDVCKHGFNIGLVRKKRHSLKQKYPANCSKEPPSMIVRRRIFINISKLQTIPEEDEV